MLLFVSIVVICMKLHKLFGILNNKTRKQHKQHEFIVFEKRKDKAWQEKLSHDFHCFKIIHLFYYVLNSFFHFHDSLYSHITLRLL